MMYTHREPSSGGVNRYAYGTANTGPRGKQLRKARALSSRPAIRDIIPSGAREEGL